MKRKICLICTLVLYLLSCTMFTGCQSKKPSAPPSSPKNDVTQESSTPNETNETNITKTEGQFIDAEPPIMEGTVVAMDDETITLKVLGRDYKLNLSKRAKEEIVIFKDKYNKTVEIGSYLQIPYEKTNDGEYIAQNIRFVKSN